MKNMTFVVLNKSWYTKVYHFYGMSKKEKTRKRKHQVQSLRSVKIDPFFSSFYVSHFSSIQSGHSFETSTSLTCYKWSKPVIFQVPRCNLFPIKLRLICSSLSVIRNIWMTAVKLRPVFPLSFQRPYKHTATRSHWQSSSQQPRTGPLLEKQPRFVCMK